VSSPRTGLAAPSGGTIATFADKIPSVDGRGFEIGIPCFALSDVRLSLLDVERMLDGGWDGLAGSVTDDFFLLQRWGIVVVGSLACGLWVDLLGSVE
jgi:hypothetical protein